ncbi:MAG: hypothetical protein E7203_08600 [Selenomonas ruminantium]|jgi:hypothetical protein|uniref:Haloacid dehalogenase-like hydrolase n=1 Tax=Selenomonas ruminantium TaxID=971 RepID=A0A927WIP9_SELRU|nr:hypothetical protein [Selenomonas ruminantium]MBE6085491.1 hypothetical protein [Selenomonas ruminantium]
MKGTMDGFIDKKIIVYGTGLNAKSFIIKYREVLDIICCLDKVRRFGDCAGIPIKNWAEIEIGTADCIVVAATDKYIREIYFRIIYDCDRNKLDIYDWRGVNLRDVYSYEYVPYNVRPFLKNERMEMLKRAIDDHEAISFDLFDTLIMRRTMEPEDVFKIVAAHLEDSCPVKDEFFLLRKSCELEVNAVVYGFDEIYRRIEKKAGLKVHELDYIAEMEIAIEKEVMVPRNGMKEILEYAVSKGKRVNIISDMYLSVQVLEDLINHLGIQGYEYIFVSCEHKASKGGELFDIYKEKIKANSYLHIGDNQYADGECALLHGIDVFMIPSGIDLLRASPLRKILYYAKGDANRRLIGECIAELFQDPFCLCGAGGRIPVALPHILASCFIAPIVYKYLEALINEVKQKKYNKVLLGARDGYIFDRIIKEVPLGLKADDFVYMYVSRTLAFQLGLGTTAVDEDYKKYLEVDDRRKIEQDKDFLSGKEKIPYRHTKENYTKYLRRLGVTLSGKYLFCDLISGGTVQHSIQGMFSKGLDGFYLGRSFNYQHREISYVSVFERGEIPNDQLLVDCLETFVVSPETTVTGMDSQGEFLFADEKRSKSELVLLSKVQDEIVVAVKGIADLAATCEGKIDKMLTYMLLRGVEYIEPIGQLSQLKEWIYYDNNGEQTRLFV